MKENHQAGRKFIYIVLIMTAIVFTFGPIASATPPTPISDMKSQVLP
jgi:hypothetical protein